MEFRTRDAARPDFWDERYAAGVTPWDLGRAPFELESWAARQAPGSKVLIPGCGRAYEAVLFARHRLAVTAIDISAQAVAAARAVLGEAPGIALVQADFFAPLEGEPFDLIYERAFACALPPRLWPAWAQRCAALLAPGGRLVGYFLLDEAVDPATRRGPPFAMRRAELDALLAPSFDLAEATAADEQLAVLRGQLWMTWMRRAGGPTAPRAAL
ncbi:MAG TPA: methyltransferase domain-containing protein [Burkholderiaceae bacterium]|nr:methyltransferase domain-containing protein [Burkholderiaceae bacterium]